MALNITVQPFIQKMLMPPDAEGAGESLGRAFSNFAGSYLAAKEGKRAEQTRKAQNPQSYDEAVSANGNPPDKPSGFENFARAYLGGRGQQAMGSNPALRPQVEILNQRVREGALEERTLNAITGQNPVDVAREAGNLTPSQIPDWLRRNAALRAIPWGQKIWDGVASAYGDSEQAKISSAKAQALGRLSLKYPSLDVSNPDQLAKMRKNESVEELYKRAKDSGKLLNDLPDDWFFDDGTINEQKAVPGLGRMPVSEQIQSREDVALAKIIADLKAKSDILDFKLTHGGGFTPGAMEKDVKFIQGLEGLTAEEKKKAIETRLYLEGKPGVEKEKISKADYVAKKIDLLMKENPTKETEVPGLIYGKNKKTVPMTREDGIKVLEAEYDKLYGSSGLGFTKGQRVKQGGITYEFDGSKMVPVP